MAAGRGRSDRDPDIPGRAIKRLSLFDDLIKARESGDRRKADKTLVEANRWLARYPFDTRIIEARDRLRDAYPVDAEDA